MTAQTATILVTDLVGSTALRAEVGEDRAEELRRAHDRVLADVADEAGGTVVKGLGDGLLVTFAGAAEAVGAAVSMQQGVESLSRREGRPLAIRVGVSAGDVTFEDGDAFGTPVVEASRLCADAAGGQILVADVVRVLARGRGGHEVVSAGTRELKGLAEPVDAYEVRWEPVRTPADLRAKSPYVGREAERRVLRDRLDAAAAGTGGLVFVVGEPGIGKTRLVEEVVADLADDAATVLVGGCHDGDVVAHAPFVEALTAWVRRTPSEEVAGVLGQDAAVIGRIVPAVRASLADVGEPLPVAAEEATARLHEAVAAVVARLADRAPVVLVLDDLHWADDGTVALTRAVAREATRCPAVVVATYRDTDLDRRHPLAQALPLLRREVEPTRIALSGLAADEVQRLLEQISDQEVAPAFAELLTEQTEGNPFFLREMLLHLTESGLLRFEDGVWVADEDLGTAIPEGVREVVGKRLSQLSHEANQLLGVGAAFEVSFLLPVAAEVAGLDEETALDAIDEALAARIVEPAKAFDQYAFTHALFRQTLIDELNPSRQVRLHRAVAEALEKAVADDPTPEQSASLMRHWHLSAALPGAERGVPHAIRVARDATDRYAPGEALASYDVALDLVPPGDERELDLRRARARAHLLAGDTEEALLAEGLALGEQIASAEGDDAAADALAHLTTTSWTMGDFGLSWRYAEIGRRWLDRARRDATWICLRAAELDEADFNDEEQPGIPLDSPERREVQQAYESVPIETRPQLLMGPSSRAAALRFIEEERGHDINIIGRWYTRWSAGEFAALADEYEGDLSRIRAAGSYQSEAFMLAVLARTFVVLGRHEAADDALARGFELLPRLPPESNPAFQLLAAAQCLTFVRGVPISVTDIAALGDLAHNPSTRWASLAVDMVNAFAHSLAGEVDEAIAVLDRVVDGIERAPGWAPNYPLLTANAASTLVNTGRTDHAELIERNVRTKVLEPDIRYDIADARWSMAQLCAVTGRVDEARQWYAEAVRVLTEQGSVAMVVHVHHDEARFELHLGTDPERFRTALGAARAGCTHPAMAPWHPRLDALEADTSSA